MMQEILSELNREAGVVGSMVVTPDGMVVAAELGPSLDEDTVAALAAYMLGGVKNAMAMTGEQTATQFEVTSDFGRMVFLDVGPAYLVVVTHQNVNVDQTMIAIRSAAYKITHRRA